MVDDLLARIRSLYPDASSLPYYCRLFADGWNFDATMRAHLQDLARAICCRGLREIQLARLDEAKLAGYAEPKDLSELYDAIVDELDSPVRRSHYDLRLMIFDGTGFQREQLEQVTPTQASREATSIFREIFEQGTLIEITAAVGAIEEWYVPLAARLEECYLGIGYSKRQVSTYTVHKAADVRHSAAALGFVAKYASAAEVDSILERVKQAFKSVNLYDQARYVAALAEDRSLNDFLQNA